MSPGCMLIVVAVGSVCADAPLTLTTAAEIGVSPVLLAASGFNATSAHAVLLRIDAESELCENLLTLHQQESEVASAATELAQECLENEIMGDLLIQMTAAQSELQSIRQQIEQTRTAMFESAMTDVSIEMVGRVQACRVGFGHRVPAAFCVVNREEQEWREIEAALRAEARANRLQAQLDPDFAQLLADIRSSTPVIVADQALMTHLAEVEQVFATFTSDPP